MQAIGGLAAQARRSAGDRGWTRKRRDAERNQNESVISRDETSNERVTPCHDYAGLQNFHLHNRSAHETRRR